LSSVASTPASVTPKGAVEQPPRHLSPTSPPPTTRMRRAKGRVSRRSAHCRERVPREQPDLDEQEEVAHQQREKS
jgi:hypothetical protein